jgi:hypothetical protein
MIYDNIAFFDPRQLSHNAFFDDASFDDALIDSRSVMRNPTLEPSTR